MNAALNVPGVAPANQILPRAGGGVQFLADGAEQSLAATITLPPAGLMFLDAVHRPPILLPREPARAAETATKAPRIAIEVVEPSVDSGRFAAKCSAGALVDVSADVIVDGHQALGAVVAWRAGDSVQWHEARLTFAGNDRWIGAFPAERVGRYLFTVEAWIDVFAAYRDELAKKHAAGATLDNELIEGCRLIRHAAERSGDPALVGLLDVLTESEPSQQLALLLQPETARVMAGVDDRPFRVRHEPAMSIEAERTKASFASWYELFPRSQSGDAGRHGTFTDVIARLPAIRDMGFDVLYLPPIHPIGRVNRKGRNNALRAAPTDPGSPYAIGAEEGGTTPSIRNLARWPTSVPCVPPRLRWRWRSHWILPFNAHPTTPG